MKNILNRLLIAVFGIAMVVGCTPPDNVIYDVFDGVSYGAVLRTLEVTSFNYDLADLTSRFEVVVEEQDEQMGGLLGSVNVYLTYVDQFEDDSVDNSKDEALLRNIPASSFTTSDNGLPMTTITVTFGDVLDLFNFNAGEYNAGDLVGIRLEVVLTDGRTFSAADGSGSLQGSYFASPYSYTAAVLCSPLPGDYVVDMYDTYGDGWQTNTAAGGNGLQVNVDGTIIEVGMCSPYETPQYACVDGDGYFATDVVTIPVGAQSMEWYFPGDTYGEISFEVYAPTGELLFSSGAPGALGAGSVPVVRCNI